MIRRIFIDNFQDLYRIGGTIDLRFSKGCSEMRDVWEKMDVDDLSEFLDNLLNKEGSHFEIASSKISALDKEESITIVIETDNILYTKILAPDGITTVLEETFLKKEEKTLRRELGDELNFIPHLKFCEELYSSKLVQPFYVLGRDRCRFIPQESPEVVEFCNKIVPQVFPEITRISPSGGGVHKLSGGEELEISKEAEGGGYNQLLNILKGLYIATKTDSIIVFRYWKNHLHPILANAMLGVFKELDKEGKIIGSLILE